MKLLVSGEYVHMKCLKVIILKIYSRLFRSTDGVSKTMNYVACVHFIM